MKRWCWCVQATSNVLLQLSVLDLGRNRISGTLPSSWSGLPQASHVWNLISIDPEVQLLCRQTAIKPQECWTIYICMHVPNEALPMQLSILDVEQTLLMGTLPEAWSHINSVVSRCQIVYICCFILLAFYKLTVAAVRASHTGVVTKLSDRDFAKLLG